MEKKTMMNMPHEMIIQILLRLPVKSLSRFKCVCKSWFSLISHPNFTKSHFDLAAAQTQRILFISTSAPKTLSINFEESLNHYSPSLKLNYLDPHFYFYYEIKASCRGFIFFHCSSNIYLWNPSTGVHKQIPLSPIESNLDANAKYFCYLYGFGYDQSSNDYLVVLMSYDTDLANISSHLEFFSLRDNNWKEIEGTHFPYMNACDDPKIGLFFNGAIHWLAFRHDDHISMNVIVAFDLVERKLVEMHLPDDDFYHEPADCDLWVFGESLSLWAMGDVTLEIWVMNEYKVQSSWTKTLVLPIDGIPSKYFSPTCCTKSGDIIGTDGGNGLVKYNDKGELLEHHSYCNDGRRSQVAVYTESLLSLPDDNEQT